MPDLEPRLLAYVDQFRAGMAEQSGDDFKRMREGLFGVQVCTSLDDAAATARLNLTPSGTSNGWQLTEDPDNGPVPCADKPGTHRHLLFEC